MSSGSIPSNSYHLSSTSSNAPVIFPAPPSFALHRMSLQSHCVCNKPNTMKRPSISSVDDPIVHIPRQIGYAGEAIGDGQKSPAYQIPQRSGRSSISVGPGFVKDDIKLQSKPRPLSFQSSLSAKTVPPRFSATAANKGLSISPSLARATNSFESIWSVNATMPSTAVHGWNSPLIKNPTTTVGMGQGSVNSAGQVAKQRGLAIAIVKDNGGVLPITPSLGTSGLRSPGAMSKASDVKVMSPSKRDDEIKTSGNIPVTSAIASGLQTGAGSKKEIILCKFYHTPGLTCTSRPCRFVHALSALTSPGLPDDESCSPMLMSSHSVDPTSGIFAHAQSQSGQPKFKHLKVTSEGLDLNGVEMGERVVVEGENGEEITGHVFLMSGGGKGAGGKGREKYKTVPCKDFLEGHCPYGDYCSFLHDEKPYDVDMVTEKKQTEHCSPDAQKPTIGSSLSSWFQTTQSLSKSFTTIEPQNGDKPHKNTLPSFRTFTNDDPFMADWSHDFASNRTPSPAKTVTPKAYTPPAKASELFSIPLCPVYSAPPQTNAWADSSSSLARQKYLKRTPTKIAEFPKSDLSLDTISRSFEHDYHFTTPPSALSFRTEFDHALPFDHANIRNRLRDMEEKLDKSMADKSSDHPTLDKSLVESFAISSRIHSSKDLTCPQFSPPYPWGMPMSPLVANGYQDSNISDIDSSLGVMWTPVGWAVADAAMKNAIRDVENMATHSNAKKRKPKSYYRTRPCKFFAEGVCPHGDGCTFLHIVPASSPEPASSSDSESADPKKKHEKYKTLPCKFFNSAAGCINGDDCAFLHTRVVPDSVPLVDRPRPWRTKPCRHYQLGRCMLGDACHFAHVEDPIWAASGRKAKDELMIAKLDNLNEAISQGLTEASIRQTLEGIRALGLNKTDEEDDDDDDIQIVTHAMSSWPAGRSLAV
ncbi:uncharacterized protein L203_105698 [Cryptococcus depauperatus CBS 7841]|uniref:Uncharacterized protein n=1 Tax=Cryptococcus depauperatus CBS 7841 TaxID=1295531 RepID=A0A1E3IFA5_9TREE|nr:hypothetical protein L203_03574 [Cryptococcus depauperatus CBS 7841]